MPRGDVRAVGRVPMAGPRSEDDATSTSFGVRRDKASIGTFELPLLGAYNVRNALAAIAVGAAAGLHTETMVEGLRKFRGVRRRLEHRGTASGVAVYDDFAHHPTAIGETLEGVRSAYPGRRIWAIFEPRSATSCRRIFQADFARALAKADRVILPAVFRSTLPEPERLSAEAWCRICGGAGKDARYIPDTAEIVRTVAKEAGNGDLVIVMSNGGFDNIHQKLLSALEARASTERWTDFRIMRAGDPRCARRIAARIDPATSARAVALADAIEARIRRVRDVVVGYCSVTVYFDPLELDTDKLVADAPAQSAAAAPECLRRGALDRCRRLLWRGIRAGPGRSGRVRAASRRRRRRAAHRRDLSCVHGGVPPGFALHGDRRSAPGAARACDAADARAGGLGAIAAGQTGIYPSETPAAGI